MKNNNINILVVGHKSCEYPLPQCYKFVAVGNNKTNISHFDFNDSDGVDNISNKNNTYNEFTGQYWFYKNVKLKSNDIVGLVHYRRFFYTNFYSLKREKKILNEKCISKIFSNYKVILPHYYIKTKEIYEKMSDFTREDPSIRIQAITNTYPEFVDNWLKISLSKYRCTSSMFICSYQDFLEYSEFAFKILFEYEKLLLEKHGKINDREIGFFGEWLPNLFFATKYSKKEIKRYVNGLASAKLKFKFIKFVFSIFGFFKFRNFIFSKLNKYPL